MLTNCATVYKIKKVEREWKSLKQIRRVKYSTNPVEICRQSFSARALEDAFVPTYDRMKRYQGSGMWNRGLHLQMYGGLEILTKD